MKTKLLIPLALIVCGCGGAQIKQQKGEIDGLNLKITGLEDKLREKENQIAALQSEKADLDSKVQELQDNVKSIQTHLDQEKKDNESLYSSAASNKDQLDEKIKQLVKEKSELGGRLGETEKAKAALSARLKRLTVEAASLKQKADALQAEVDKSGAAKAAEDKARSERLARTHEEMGALADTILKEVQAEQAKIDQDGGTITVVLREPLLFPANQAKLTDSGAALLDRLGAALKALPARDIHIQGHTDNAPIKWELFGRFTSHWDLSAAQAIAVARYLHEHAGLDPMKLLAEGYGEFRPVKPNSTEDGRAANRRVALVIEAPQP
jgi:chemotaxis protein MotB